MKKYILFLLPVLIMMLGIKSYAITGAQLMAQFNEATNNNFDNLELFEDICNKWETLPAYNLLIYPTAGTGFYIAAISPAISITDQINFESTWYRSSSFNNDSNNRPTNTWQQINFNGSATLYGDFLFLEQYEEPIDWYNNYEFDPSIPTPDIYRATSSLKLDSHSYYEYQVPIELKMVPVPIDGRQYYIIYRYRMFKAKTINITKNGNNNPVDNIEEWWSSHLTMSHTEETIPRGQDFSLDFNEDATITGEWEDFADDHKTTYTGLTTGWYNLWSDGNIPNTYHYPDNKWLGSFGSIFEITFCYAEIRDDKVYTGYWVRYTTSNPKKLALVNYYEQNILHTGEEINYSTQSVSPYQVESESDQEGATIPNSINSGNNYTINISTQQVPNDMEYPTIVSYNHDNIFTTFVGTYNTAGNTLSGFAQFLNSTLLWIPSEIWFIVGMGFSMAILIMIIKIL